MWPGVTGFDVSRLQIDIFKDLMQNSLLDVSISEHETIKLSRNIGNRLPSDDVRSLKNEDPNYPVTKA